MVFIRTSNSRFQSSNADVLRSASIAACEKRGASCCIIGHLLVVTFSNLGFLEGAVENYHPLSPLGATQRLSRLTLWRDVFHNRGRLARGKMKGAGLQASG